MKKAILFSIVALLCVTAICDEAWSQAGSFDGSQITQASFLLRPTERTMKLSTLPSALIFPTPGDCMTCTGTFGNGVWIGLESTVEMQSIRKAQMELAVDNVAGPGIITAASPAALLTAAVTDPLPTPAIKAVFVCSWFNKKSL